MNYIIGFSFYYLKTVRVQLPHQRKDSHQNIFITSHLCIDIRTLFILSFLLSWSYVWSHYFWWIVWLLLLFKFLILLIKRTDKRFDCHWSIFLFWCHWIIIKLIQIWKMTNYYFPVVLYLCNRLYTWAHGLSCNHNTLSTGSFIRYFISLKSWMAFFRKYSSYYWYILFTCSLWQCLKSFRLDILLTLKEITSRLGIFSRMDKFSSSFPHKFKFFILYKLFDLVFDTIKSTVSYLPMLLSLILKIWIYFLKR